MPDHTHRFDRDLGRNPANHVILSPVTFLRQAAALYPDRDAIIHGRRRYSYRAFYERSCRLGHALQARGIGVGDCVAIMAPNIPEMLEAHNGVPMIGAVLNSLNIRLDPKTIAFILEHGQAKLVLCDREFAPTIEKALQLMDQTCPRPALIDIADSEGPDLPPPAGAESYEAMLNGASLVDDFDLGDDEWRALSLLYTSGTTGNPKGCVYHSRGAYLNSIGNLIAMGLTSQSCYLWTLPMFHCDGWTFTWAVTAARATHICLRDIKAASVYRAILDHGATHMCGAPVVLNMLANAAEEAVKRFDQTVLCATGGASPPSAVIEAMERRGFRVLHLYGLTESYGPAGICVPQASWEDLPDHERTAKMARQGVGSLTLEQATVMDPETMQPVPADGVTIGEVMLRGNTIMKGYLANREATEAAFAGGWFHSGDLAVIHADGYIEVKDRSKDIIISGGENISSIEVEEALYHHPAVLEAAVVAKPDEAWGEVPCAFITLHEGKTTNLEELRAFCRDHLAGYKLPRAVMFGPLPKTSTGKIQKFALRAQLKPKLDG